MRKDKIPYILLSVLLWLITWLIWWRWCPELMNYQEQYQLFLFTGNYFAHSINMMGGLADYISEFLTQFFYVPCLGAAVIASVITLLQVLVGFIGLQNAKDQQAKPLAWVLSLLPAIVILRSMGDENSLLSFPVAIILMCLAVIASHPLTKCVNWLYGTILALGFIVLYWLIGPIATLYPIISIAQKISQSAGLNKAWLWLLAAVIFEFLIIKAFAISILDSYPENQLFLGINYYRLENIHPDYIATTVCTLLVATLSPLFLNIRTRQQTQLITASLLLIILVSSPFYVNWGYDQNKMEVFRYDALVRNEKWHDILKMAQQNKPSNELSLQAINLALGKTGQLGDRMFEFPQQGMEGLMAKYERNNTTCLITAETFYHLGMVNSAFRYNFDLQEAIMNNRKSGRFMKRMAECLMINGKYKAAQKYLTMLKHSLYYNDWAREAESLMADENALNRHSNYGEKRRVRFKQEMLYDYNNLDKMFGLLAIESQGRNRLAWDYFNAALLLKGDLPTFTGMYHFANEDFKQQEIPRHHQEAIAMFWTMGHQDFDGLPYQISDGVKHHITNFARSYSQNPDIALASDSEFVNTYWTYFLNHQPNLQPQTQNEANEREG